MMLVLRKAIIPGHFEHRAGRLIFVGPHAVRGKLTLGGMRPSGGTAAAAEAAAPAQASGDAEVRDTPLRRLAAALDRHHAGVPIGGDH